MPFRRATWDHDAARWLYIVINIAAAVAMAILFVMIQNDRSLLNREANIRATQIQQQRYDATFTACTEQNQRHDKSVHRLHTIAKNYIKKYPAQAAQVKASIKQNISLIDALVPDRNCQVVAKKAVHPLVNPNGR